MVMALSGVSSLLAPVLLAHVGHHIPDNPTFDQVMTQWEYDWTVLVPLAMSIAIYVTGWLRLRAKHVIRFTPAKLYLFLGGMAALYVALQSPLDPLGDNYLISAHMIQHLFLWFIVPLLVWLSEPFAPFVFGLPVSIRKNVLAPIMRSAKVRGFFVRLTHPAVAWPVYVVSTWLWHLPTLYDLALGYQWVHDLEHLTFLTAGFIFWWPVIRPYPAKVKWTPWLLLPYLMLAGLQGTFISAIILFAPHVIYPFYLDAPRITSLTPLADQQLAGAIMWIPGSIVYVTALGWVARGLFFDTGGLGDQGTKMLRKSKKTPVRVAT